jgi:hypothetical protein
MKNVNRAIVLTLALAAAGCGWRRTPVPVLSDTGSTALLVGNWAGEYSSKETGRVGSISFELASEKDTAYCDVVMVPRTPVNATPAQANQAIQGGARLQAAGQPLKIQFVRLGDKRVTGTLEPYTDPDCGCRVVTTFVGVFTSPNTIEGTYTTRGTDMLHQTTGGQWKVTRQKSAATLP